LYKMKTTNGDKFAIFIIIDIYNQNNSLVKKLNMKKNFIILANVNANPKVVWSGYISNKLTVPYLYQRKVPTIGKSACASASSAMVLAYYNKIGTDEKSMIKATENVFTYTGSSISYGLPSRDNLVNTLKSKYSFSFVKFEHPTWKPLYKIIQDEINAGRPLILGSRYSLVNGGHYTVIIGYDGISYENAKLIINDPEGKWLGYMGGYQLGKGKDVKYDFTDITGQSSDGVFVIKP